MMEQEVIEEMTEAGAQRKRVRTDKWADMKGAAGNTEGSPFIPSMGEKRMEQSEKLTFFGSSASNFLPFFLDFDWLVWAFLLHSFLFSAMTTKNHESFPSELWFVVVDEGQGYSAYAKFHGKEIDASLNTQADSLDELYENIADAVECCFGEDTHQIRVQVKLPTKLATSSKS
jgi:hypothetical protein